MAPPGYRPPSQRPELRSKQAGVPAFSTWRILGLLPGPRKI